MEVMNWFWFPFFNKMLSTHSQFARKIVDILNDENLSDEKQRIGSIKLLCVHFEEDLVLNFSKIIELEIFTPNTNPKSNELIKVENANGINVIYSVN